MRSGLLVAVVAIVAATTGCAVYAAGLREARVDHVPDDLQACSMDDDCIPEPATCHKVACIARGSDRAYADRAVDPEDCIEDLRAIDLFPNDECACERHVCVNPKHDVPDF